MRREGAIATIQERLDDKRSEKWVSWEKAKAELRIDESGT